MGAVTVQRALLLRNQEHCSTVGLPGEHLSCSGLYKGWHVTCIDFRGLQHFPPCTRDGNCSWPLSGCYGFTLLLYAYAPLLNKLWRKEKCSHFREILIVHFANSVQAQGWEAVSGFLKLVWWRPDLKSVKCLALSLFFEDSFFQSLFTCGTETFMYEDRSRW